MQSRQCATSGLFAASVDHNVWGSNPTLGQGILLTDLNAKQSIFLMTRRRATSKQSNDSSALEHEQTEHMSNARLIPSCTSVYRTCGFHYVACCARYHSQSPNSQWPLPFRRDPVVRETNWTITGHSKTYGGWDTKQSINVLLLWRPLKNVVSLKSPSEGFLLKLEPEVNIHIYGTPSSCDGVRMEVDTEQNTLALHPPVD